MSSPPATTTHQRPLSGGERRAVALLGIPTLALALSVTVVTTYLPVVAEGFGGSTVTIGVIIGIEGLVALWLPLLAGTWSDRLRTRLGGRLPFLLGASPFVVAGLAAMGAVGSVKTLGAAALVFFLGYFIAYEPYRALYPDALGDDVEGRAQGTQALWRGLGTGLALVGGGLLLGLGQAVPFAAAAAVYVAAVTIFTTLLVRRGVPDRDRGDDDAGGLRERARALIRLVRDHASLRAFFLANALWELSLAALKTFVVLYVTKGLGYSRDTASLIIGGVAVIVLLGAFGGGRLADRFGRVRVMRLALPVYGGGLLIPFLVTSPVAVAVAAPFIAIGGGVLMALPYALLIPLMPDGRHGALTGYYSLTRGLGTWLGPLIAGLAISALAGPFSATRGYQATWGVCAAAVLLSLVPLRRLEAGSES
jgi:Na+/melibiose symporter-like transporter